MQFDCPPGTTARLFHPVPDQAAHLGDAVIALACRPRMPTLIRPAGQSLAIVRFLAGTPIGGWSVLRRMLLSLQEGAQVWLAFDGSSFAFTFADTLRHSAVPVLTDLSVTEKASP